MRCFRDGKRDEIFVGAGGKDAVEPGLFIDVAGGSECGAGELFCV